MFAPNKYETSSDIVTNKKSGSIEPKMERVPNNTICYIQTPPKNLREIERGRERERERERGRTNAY